MLLRARRFTWDFPRRPLLMGIVNLGADSFSGDGRPDPQAALDLAREHRENGADWIDVGAESARTNRGVIGVAEETDRLCAFIEKWKASELAPTPLSLNTWRPEVVRQVLPMGGDLLNDLGGLATVENAKLCAQHGAALLIMHTQGQPKVAHTRVRYRDVLEELERFFEERIARAEAAGIPRDAIVIDPGIDFAKQREDNLRIFRDLERLHRFHRPILLPISRKTVIGDVLGISQPAERDAGTVACLVQGWLKGASIFRVHHVRAARQTLATLEEVTSPEASI